MTRRLALGLAGALAAAGPAAAAPDLRPADLDRLARFEEAAGAALLRALGGGAPEDRDALAQALAGAPGILDPAGEWDCVTIKLGGIPDLVVYTPFRCRITALSPTEWRFEKLTGSQRTDGVIALHEGRAIYRGAGFTGDAPAVPYERLPAAQEPVGDSQTVPQVAVFEQTGYGSARLMFPYPLLESDFDILHLTR